MKSPDIMTLAEDMINAKIKDLARQLTNYMEAERHGIDRVYGELSVSLVSEW